MLEQRTQAQAWPELVQERHIQTQAWSHMELVQRRTQPHRMELAERLEKEQEDQRTGQPYEEARQRSDWDGHGTEGTDDAEEVLRP